jgi:ornithine cyclodeaminase/alanine dehydrogenase-like protein (mu-crystallin family)
MDDSVVIIGRRELASLMDLDAYLASSDAAFRAHAQGRATVPMPLHIAVERGGFHAKGAFVALDHAYAAVKVNSNFPGNPALGMPTIQGAVLLFHAGDGRLLAILDSIEITSRRTAAASALAARHLSREDSSAIAICGCGEQARAQLAAIRRVRPIEHAFAWDVDAAKAVTFAAEMTHHLHLGVKPVAHLRDATLQSDIVVTCTSSNSAFLSLGDIAAGTFIAAVGADSPHKSEIHPELLSASKVVTDLTSQAQVMGDLHHAIDAGAMSAADVHAELGEVVTGRKPGRTTATEVTLFDSTGVAIQDVAAAAWAYERAIAAREIANA